MSSSSNNDPIPPGFSPQINQDWAAYENAMDQYNLDIQEIKQLAAMLVHAKSQFGYNMYPVMELQNAVQDKGGAQVAQLAAIENIDTDLRNLNQEAQNGFNGIEGNPLGDPDNPNNPATNKDAQEILDGVQMLEAFLKWQSTLPHPVVDSGTIANIQSAINNIKAPFGKDWGKSGAMAADISQWTNNQTGGSQLLPLQPPGSPVNAPVGGTYSPQLQEITDGFQTNNQSTSALATSTNTQLQFQSEEYKQGLSQLQAVIESVSKLTAAMIQNERSN